MRGRRLFLLVEGNDDQRFFSRIIRPLLLPHYVSVDIILYASMKSSKVCRYIRGLESMHYDFILVADIDQEPTVHMKKQVLITRFSNLSPDRVLVIVREIESWYLAGLDDSTSAAVGVRRLKTTDFVTKEHFNRWIPLHYGSRIAFMVKCLQHFSIRVALEKNRSFHYFMHHYRLLDEPDGTEGQGIAAAVPGAPVPARSSGGRGQNNGEDNEHNQLHTGPAEATRAQKREDIDQG